MAEFPVDVLRSVVSGSDPAAVANTGKLYTKTVDGTVNGFYRADDGTISQVGPLAPTDPVPYSALTNAINVNSASLAMSTAIQPLHSPATFSIATSSSFRIRGTVCINLTTAVSHSLSFRFLFPTFGVTTTFGGLVACWSADSAVFSGQPRYTQMTNSGSIAISSTGVFNMRYFQYDCFGTTNASTSGTLSPCVSFSVAPAASGIISLATCEVIYLGTDTFTNQGGWT